MTVSLDGLAGRQRQAWLALLQVSRAFPTGWCIIGGQMVHLICQERGFTANRPTDDGDIALDVRAHPTILRDFTDVLASLGFAPAGTSPEGHQHRWVKDQASIDILVPRSVGARAPGRTGAGGGTTLGSPGTQQALDRAEEVAVQLDSESGTVRRPNLLGALVSKAAAYGVTNDRYRERHLGDFAALSATIERSDRIREQLTLRDRRYLRPMLLALAETRRSWVTIEGADRGLELVGAMVGAAEVTRSRPVPGSIEPTPPVMGPSLDL